jgi:hypothetical protein
MSTTRDNQPLEDINGELTALDSTTQQSKPALQSKRQKFWQFWIDRGPALTVLALLLSIFQLIQASCGAQDIKLIADSVSTQYVDIFPKNMPEIIKLINRTEHSLTVITDVAAYGHFSSPPNSANYVRALEALNDPDRNIHIEVLCYNPTKAREKLVEQFGIQDFEAIKFETFKKENKTYKTYLSRHNGEEPQSAGALYTQIIQAGDALMKNLIKSNSTTTVKTTSEDLPIFMWIRDDKEAIFSLHNYGQSPREDSFRTTDARFIARLKEISKAEFDQVTGTYVNQADNGKYRELKPDKTFFVQIAPGRGQHGTYELEGDTITFKTITGTAIRAKIQDNKIVDSDGETWIKTSAKDTSPVESQNPSSEKPVDQVPTGTWTGQSKSVDRGVGRNASMTINFDQMTSDDGECVNRGRIISTTDKTISIDWPQCGREVVTYSIANGTLSAEGATIAIDGNRSIQRTWTLTHK